MKKSVFWDHKQCTQAQQRVFVRRGNTTVISTRQRNTVDVFTRKIYQEVKNHA